MSINRFAMRTLAAICIILPTLAPAALAELWAVSAVTKERDPAAAAKDLVQKAKAAAKDPPELVLVFTYLNGGDAKFMTAFKEQFDKSIIYGGMSHRGSVLNQETQDCTATIMLLGGGFTVTPAQVSAADAKKKKAPTNGTALAEQLKAAYEAAAGKGRLIVVLGTGQDDWSGKFVQAAAKKLGPDAFFWGGNLFVEYYQGEVVQNGFVGLLLSGDFHCGFGLAEAKEPEGAKEITKKDFKSKEVADFMKTRDDNIHDSAKAAATSAVGQDKDDVVAALMCSCCSRYINLVGEPTHGYGRPNAPTYLDRKPLAEMCDAPFIGFYGEGEIGHAGAKQPPFDRAEHISVCVLHKGAPAATQPATVAPPAP